MMIVFRFNHPIIQHMLEIVHVQTLNQSFVSDGASAPIIQSYKDI